MNQIKLTPRLAAAASFIPTGARLADIGTDHGFLPVWCAEQGVCQSVTASDLREGPLSSAVRTAEAHLVSDKIQFICASGLEGLAEGSVDTVVIAGMGGETIIGILEASPRISEHVRLILQPQSKVTELQCWLDLHGFQIEEAALAEDAHRLYLIFTCSHTDAPTKDPGPHCLRLLEGNPLLPAYIEGLLSRCFKEQEGLQHALCSAGPEERDKIITALANLQNTITNYRRYL